MPEQNVERTVVSIPGGGKPLENARAILEILEEAFKAELVSYEITESTVQLDVVIPVSALR